MKTPKVEIIPIAKDVTPVVTKFNNLKITDEKSLTTATEILSQANTLLKKYKEERKSKTDPLQVQIDQIDVQYEPTEKALKNIISKIREDMGTYQTNAARLLAEKEEAIAGRIGNGKGKLKMETAVAKINDLDKPADKIVTASGGVSFRSDKKLKITNIDLIVKHIYETKDYSLLDLNEQAILIQLKEGKKVPGAEIEIVQVPINKRF